MTLHQNKFYEKKCRTQICFISTLSKKVSFTFSSGKKKKREKKKNLTSKYTRVLCSEDQGALLISDLKMRCLPVYLLSLHLGAATKTK